MNLFPYQETGRRWLKGHNSSVLLLADGMGLGKTPQVATAFHSLNLNRVLVIGPAISRWNWQREIKDWTGQPAQVLTKLEDQPAHKGIVICSYDYVRLSADYPRRLLWMRSPWQLVVLDEAHLLKPKEDDTSARTVAVLGACGIARFADRVWFVTGTPMPNHAGELWLFASFAGLANLDYQDWTKRYCTGYRMGTRFCINGTKREAIPELKRLVMQSGLVLRRKKEEVRLDLPPVTYGEITVDAPELDDTALLHQFPSFVLEDPQGGRRALLEKVEAERSLVQVALGDLGAMTQEKLDWLQAHAKGIATLIRYNGLLKVNGVVELIEKEIRASPEGKYRKYALFAENKGTIETLRERLRIYGAVTLYGKTNDRRRKRNVDDFNTKMDTQVIIGHFITAGTNISLVGGQDMLIVQMPFVPGLLDQAVKRMDRIGQKRSVLVRFVSLANDPLDRAIVSMLKRKTQEISAVMDEDALFANVGRKVDDLL